MKVAPLPNDEQKRLEELKSYKVLDTLPEEDFNDFTELASHICNTPIALISLVDEARQWFKAKTGLSASETPRDVAFCSHAILQDEVFVVPDSFKDERFKDNPLATEAPHVRFYAGAPLRTPRGQHIGTLCVIDNIPRSLDEKQLQALRVLSKKVINLLELRLKNEKLFKAMSESKKAEQFAEQALKTKSLFLANMSHEIRTPLNGILGCANLLLDNIKIPENVRLLETVVSSGDSLLTLINDILDFSKLESGKMELENEPFGLRASIEQMVQLFNSRALEKSVVLSCEYDEQIPNWVYGDVTRFRQILGNLISNAIKFTENGKVEVKAQFLGCKDEACKVQFSVKDQGIGISDEGKEKLFKSFSQVDASTTKRFGGTGLGLAICKSLIELMGGEIWVESKEGEGATFHFTFSVKKAEERDDIVPQLKKTLDCNMAHERPLKILLADDNRVNQLVGKKLIEKLGYRVDVAANGIEVLDFLDKQRYDLVFMDCHMPDMDGFEATQRIISKWGEKRPRIVALTASAMKEDKEKCLSSGMDDFTTKPIDMGEIVRVIKSCEPTKSDPHSVLDEEALHNQFGGDVEVFSEIASEFIRKTSDYLNDMEAALKESDAKKLEISAHTFKGAASNFHAAKVVSGSLRLELLGREGSCEGARAIFDTLRNDVRDLNRELESLCQKKAV